MHTIQVSTPGGPEVLVPAIIDKPACADDGVIVANEVAGVNYIDTYQRTGLYPMSHPCVPGLEGCGVVSNWAVGDRSCRRSTCCVDGRPQLLRRRRGRPGERRRTSARRTLIRRRLCCPPSGADCPLSGVRHVPAQPGDTCLIHAGAGGVGLLLTQLAKSCGATVVTTVSTEEKASLSREAGADHVINYRTTNFAEVATDLLGPKPFQVVYDGVSQSVFADSLTLLAPRGLMATFGNASGPVEPVSPSLCRGPDRCS
ncbi:MAG: zinc-binding dehydrogenase [Acidimicrobiales bacterium]